MASDRYVMNDPAMETISANASTATAVNEPPDRPLIDRDDWMKERPTLTISRKLLIADRKRQSSDSLRSIPIPVVRFGAAQSAASHG
jgi:hypothetical protein